MKKLDAPFIYRLFKTFETNRIDKVSDLTIGSNLSAMDVGCGDGKFLYRNKDKWKEIIGVDTDENILNKAKKRNYTVPRIFISNDFGRKAMPFPSEKFDLVVSIATFQYLYDLDLIFKEIFRVLKKDGYFIFEVPNFAVFWRRWQFIFGRLPRTSMIEKGWDADNIHYFTYYDLRKFVIRHGFNIEKVSCSGILDGLRKFWVSLFAADFIFVCRK